MAQTTTHRFDIGDSRHIAMRIAGKGARTVLLAPLSGGNSSAWAGLFPAIATLTRTVAYENAGSANCSPGPLPRTAAAAVSDLNQALSAAGIDPPYIVVAYSAGALEAVLFALQRPGDVAGLVLIDPSIPRMAQTLYKASPDLAADEASGREALLTQLAKTTIGSEERLRAECRLSEWDSLSEASSDELEAAMAQNDLGDMPVIVRTASNFKVEEENETEVRRIWVDAHKRYASLSSIGRQREVKGSWHPTMLSDHADVVIEVIKEVIAAAEFAPERWE